MLTFLARSRQRFFYLMVFCILALNQDGFAETLEDQEEARALKLFDSLRATYYYPACAEHQKGNEKTAIELSDRAANEWDMTQWKYRWATQTRKSELYTYYTLSAICWEMLKNYDKEAECYIKCGSVRNNGILPEAVNALRKAHQYEKAEELCESAMKEGKSSGPFIDVPVLLAKVYEEEGKHEQAEKTLREFLNASISAKNYSQIREARVELADFYEKSSRCTESEKLKSQLADSTCPVCGSASTVIPISYGLPNRHVEDVHCGGCVSTNYSPQWWCKNDKIGF